MRKFTIFVVFSAVLAVAFTACSTEKQADNTSGNSSLSGSGTVSPDANDTAAAIARHVGSADWRQKIKTNGIYRK